VAAGRQGLTEPGRMPYGPSSSGMKWSTATSSSATGRERSRPIPGWPRIWLENDHQVGTAAWPGLPFEDRARRALRSACGGETAGVDAEFGQLSQQPVLAAFGLVGTTMEVVRAKVLVGNAVRVENLRRLAWSTPCDLGAGESANELGAGAWGRRPGLLPVST